MINEAANRHYYRIYGLAIRTSVPLSGIANSLDNNPPDLNVRFASTGESEPMIDNQWEPVVAAETRHKPHIEMQRAGSALRIEYNTRVMGRVCSFINEQADAVWLQFEARASQQDRTSFFIGTVLGSILRRRGQLCMHASSFVINGKAALVIGRQGAGKSTTTAAMLRFTDARLVADDVAVIEFINGQPHVLPGYAGMRLNPDAVSPVLNQPFDQLPQVFDATKKRMVALDAVTEFQTDIAKAPVPISAMYILVGSDGSETFVDEIPRLQTLLTLLENTYCNYALIDKSQVDQEFRAINQLMDSVPIRRVRRHSGFERLPTLCSDIANDLGAA